MRANCIVVLYERSVWLLYVRALCMVAVFE